MRRDFTPNEMIKIPCEFHLFTIKNITYQTDEKYLHPLLTIEHNIV